MTFTDEERVEYGNYVKKSGSFVEQFMKPLVIPMSDQPASAPQRKRTQPTMPHHVKKNKNAMNSNNSSTSLTAMDECGDKAGASKETPLDLTITIDNDAMEVPSTGRVNPRLVASDLIMSSDSSDDDDDAEIHQSSDVRNLIRGVPHSPIVIVKPTTKESTITKDPELTVKKQPSTQVSEKPSTASSLPDKNQAPSTSGTSSVTASFQPARKMHGLAVSQQNQITINVGGKLFHTSAPTLKREEESLLARMLKKHSPLQPGKDKTYFLDRDPEIFDSIIEYLRVGPSDMFHQLPMDLMELRRIYVEAEFFELSVLKKMIEQKCMCVALNKKSDFM